MEALEERHVTCIEMIVQGVPRNEIAKRLGVHPTMVWKWAQEAPFRDALEKRRNEMTTLVKEVAQLTYLENLSDAQATQLQLMRGALSEKVKLQASMDWQDRALGKAVERHAVGIQMVMPPELLEMVKIVLEEIKIARRTSPIFEGELSQ